MLYKKNCLIVHSLKKTKLNGFASNIMINTPLYETCAIFQKQI